MIRTDASSYIGSGHVMRCLVLAKGLKKKRHNVSFASRPQHGDMIDFIESKGFNVYQLEQPKQWLIPKSDADYSAWLQVSWLEDAQSLLECVDSIDLVIVDHYGINEEWEEYVQKQLNCKLFSIDDLSRTHHADLILDQTLMRTEKNYRIRNPNAKILAGCKFALLAPIFAVYRGMACNKIHNERSTRILLSMGGVDQPNATHKVLQTLKQSPLPHPQVTVLLNFKAPHYQQVKNFSLQNSDWVTHIDFIDDMARLMTKHTIAIGAPGSTSWERACIGIPSIIIPLAENQKDISQSLVQAQAAIKVVLEDIADKLPAAISELNVHWTKFHNASKSLCDGLGLKRVISQVEQLVNNADNTLKLRQAKTMDIEQVYEWQSHPKTRQFSLNSEVPSWTEHKKWMSKQLVNQCDFFYIIELLINKQAVGVIRLENIRVNEYLISIFISPAYHGRGIAKKALSSLDRLHPTFKINATVLPENIASQKLFAGADYQRSSANTFIRPPII